MCRIPRAVPRTLLLLVPLFFLLSSARVHAQGQIEFEEKGEYYYIQFNEAEGTPLVDLIVLCQRITGYPLQYQKADVEEQRVFIIGKQRIRKTPQAFFEYFQSVLVSYEFICVPYGPKDDPFFVTLRKMTPAAARQGADLFKAQAPVIPLEEVEQYKDSPGRLITTSAQLKYIEARLAIQALNPYFMNTQLESVRNVDNSNSLILTGFASKIYYVTELLKLMDVAPQEVELQFKKRELKYAVAEELEPILTQLITAARNLRPGQPSQARGASGVLTEPEPKIIAEPRSNSLIVTGSDKMVGKILGWIDKLDVETDPRGDIHVYRLKNTLAVDMQKVLDEMLKQQQQISGSRRPPGTTGGTSTTMGVEAPAQVVADASSNSLVITATKTKYAELLTVIKELDIRRRQVLIESAIVELTSRLDDVLGVEMAGLDLKDTDPDNPDNYYRPFGFSSFGLSTLEFDPENPDQSQRVPKFASGFTGGIFDGEGLSIPFLLYTLSQDNQTNILSMPSILTNDNEQAKIEANDQQPTFSFNQGQNTDTTTFNDYEKAGIALTISPSISAGNYLKLQVKIDVSDFDQSSELSPPPKSERVVETAVTMPDGHTMVIGGVITNDHTDVTSKIPLLGDLPLVGWLFRSTAKSTRKVNLYVFITPHIIGDDFANLDDISYQKKKEVEALRGDVILFDPDWRISEADERVVGAEANWIFEIPSYAEPDTGEKTPAKEAAGDTGTGTQDENR